jgi:hypothetical protein
MLHLRCYMGMNGGRGQFLRALSIACAAADQSMQSRAMLNDTGAMSSSAGLSSDAKAMGKDMARMMRRRCFRQHERFAGASRSRDSRKTGGR